MGSRLVMAPATATLRNASVRRRISRVSCHKSTVFKSNKGSCFMSHLEPDNDCRFLEK